MGVNESVYTWQQVLQQAQYFQQQSSRSASSNKRNKRSGSNHRRLAGGQSEEQIRNTTIIQNAAATDFTGIKKRAHVPPALKSVCWLPVRCFQTASSRRCLIPVVSSHSYTVVLVLIVQVLRYLPPPQYNGGEWNLVCSAHHQNYIYLYVVYH